jgi:hypothetical protein
MASSTALLGLDDAALDGVRTGSDAAVLTVWPTEGAGNMAPQRSQKVCAASFCAWHVRHAMVVVTTTVWYKFRPYVIGSAT